MLGSRRHTRYPVNLRLRLKFETGELETVTDEISLAGFSAHCANLPEVGVKFGFVVHLPDDSMVTGTACAMRIGSDGLAGFSAEFEAEPFNRWTDFISQEAGSGGVWRMISRALGRGEDKEAARSVLEKSSLGKAVRLHMVGENGEAYRVAFEKHGGDKPEESAYAKANPQVLDLTRRAAKQILKDDVHLKRSASSPVGPVRLVELSRGGYGFVAPQPTGKPALMGLQGSELIVIEADGAKVFPFFDEGDLERIAHDNFRRELDEPPKAEPPAPPPPSVREERFSKEYEHKEVPVSEPLAEPQKELREVLRSPGVRVQVRKYGERTVRLFPDVWVEVERPSSWAGAVRGFAMEDGLQRCVFALTGPGAPRVVKLDPSDKVTILREG
ncbi:MAG: hypothetical protein QM723_06130 [Myxococcaceae bacterium]